MNRRRNCIYLTLFFYCVGAVFSLVITDNSVVIPQPTSASNGGQNDRFLNSYEDLHNLKANSSDLQPKRISNDDFNKLCYADPAAAFKAAQETPHADRVDRIGKALSAAFKLEPKIAFDLFPEVAHFDLKTFPNVLEIITQNPSDYINDILHMPSGKYKERLVSAVTESLWKSDPAHTQEWIDGLPHDMQKAAIKGAYEAVGLDQDFIDSGMKLPEHIRGQLRTDIVRNHIKQWIDDEIISTGDAVSWIDEELSGGGRIAALTKLVSEVSTRDIGAAVKIVEDLPMGSARVDVGSNFVRKWGFVDLEAATDWVSGLRDDEYSENEIISFRNALTAIELRINHQ